VFSPTSVSAALIVEHVTLTATEHRPPVSPLLSIVVPAFNEQRDLPSLLKSLRPFKADPRVEVLVVDNGSFDDTGQIAIDLGAQVVRIARTTVAAARNIGARAARGRVLAFLDADIVVTELWRGEIIRLADDLEWRGEISGDVCDVAPAPSWIEQHWFRAIYERGSRNYMNSGNLVIVRDDFLAIGGFDEALVTGEDSDLCLRGVARGMTLTPRRALHAHHLGYPRTLSQFMRREAWHGRGDFASLRSAVRSPVALAAFAFMVLHASAFVALILGEVAIVLGALGAVAGLCLLASFRKFRKASLTSRLINAAIYYCYFAGRTRSLWARAR
jgi:glycosyltransferase involved in cell wall biosynthesis